MNKNSIITISIIFILILGLIFFKVYKQKNNEQILDETNEITNEINDEINNMQKLIYVEYNISQTWKQDDKKAIKYDVKLINKSKQDIENWNIVFETNGNIELSQFWNGKLELQGNKLSIKPESYNNLIEKEKEIDIGFIIFSKEEQAINSYMLYINGEEYIEEQNKVEQNKVEQNKVEQNKVEEKRGEVIQNNIEGTPVSIHGKLSVKGKNIVDKNGNTFIIQGVSTHGIAWYPQYVNLETFKTLRDEFNANTVRIAIYSDINSGYTTKLHEKVSEGVDYATKLGMYVIIDWHILSDNNPNQNKNNAIKFFTEMTNKYKNYENVIYEICNEPNGNVTWEKDVKPYAEELITKIRKIDDDAIIIVGTPTWSQDVDIVSKNPIKNQRNIVYALHFYAATHKQELRNKLKIALDDNLPVLVSEFGISDASGNGIINKNEGNTWIRYLRENGIGYVCWNLSNKNETSSILKSTTNNISNWNNEQLSEQGKWLKEIYNK